jgi:aspartokinase
MTDKIQCGGLIRREDLCLIEIQGYDLRISGRFDILGLFGDAKIPLNYLAITNCADGLRNMALCISREHRSASLAVLENIERACKPKRIKIVPDVIILTLYGPHFYEKAALAGVVYGTLRRSDIYTHSINSSVNSISFVINAADCDRTIRCLKSRLSWPE